MFTTKNQDFADAGVIDLLESQESEGSSKQQARVLEDEEQAEKELNQLKAQKNGLLLENVNPPDASPYDVPEDEHVIAAIMDLAVRGASNKEILEVLEELTSVAGRAAKDEAQIKQRQRRLQELVSVLQAKSTKLPEIGPNQKSANLLGLSQAVIRNSYLRTQESFGQIQQQFARVAGTQVQPAIQGREVLAELSKQATKLTQAARMPENFPAQGKLVEAQLQKFSDVIQANLRATQEVSARQHPQSAVRQSLEVLANSQKAAIAQLQFLQQAATKAVQPSQANVAAFQPKQTLPEKLVSRPDVAAPPKEVIKLAQNNVIQFPKPAERTALRPEVAVTKIEPVSNQRAAMTNSDKLAKAGHEAGCTCAACAGERKSLQSSVKVEVVKASKGFGALKPPATNAANGTATQINQQHQQHRA